MTLARQIELYLLDRATWVPVEEICERFQIDQRLLRADGKRRPLCRHFAISSSIHGLKHVSLCDRDERLRYKHARWKRLIAERRALREYETALRESLTGKHPNLAERHTNQLILIP